LTLFPPKEPLTEVGIDILGPLLNTVDGNRSVSGASGSGFFGQNPDRI